MLKGLFAYKKYKKGSQNFVALLTKEKGKAAMNECENDDWHSSSFIQCI